MSTDLTFAWAYKFFHPQDIIREYRANTDRRVMVTFDEEHNHFHIACNFEDTEYHVDSFTKCVDDYIKKELNRPAEDLTTQGPTQIEQLRFAGDSRSRYYAQAREIASVPHISIATLVGCELFKELIPYPPTTADKSIDRKFIEAIAQVHSCELHWLRSGLEVTSETKQRTQQLSEVLLPIVRSFDGICSDLYSVDDPVGLKLQFRKPAMAADRSLYKINNFPHGLLELHRVRWDPNSLQNITYRPMTLRKIECLSGSRNPWYKRKAVRYGVDKNNPDSWQAVLAPSAALSRFVLQNKAAEIHNWAAQIRDDLTEASTRRTSRSATPSLPAKGDIEVPTSRVLRIETPDSAEAQATQTDIEERQQDEFNFDRPRVRSAPRLRARRSETSSSVGSTTESKFIGIIAEKVETLLSQFKVFEYEEASLCMEIGQLYISIASVGSLHRPDATCEQEVFTGEHWNRAFPNGTAENKGNCFAKCLTTSADDALYMAVTNKGKSHNDRTWYRLTCRNTSTGMLGTITIEKGNTSVQSEIDEISFINIHFPEQIWDARMKSSLKRPLSAEDRKAFEALLDTVWIGQSSELPVEGEALYLRKPPHLKIISCQRHRERVHRTQEGIAEEAAVNLHITRIEELHLVGSSPIEQGFYIFAAEQQNFWFQAHLTSASIKNLLQSKVAPLSAIKEAMARLLEATRGLVIKWNDVGAGDRAKAVQFGSRSSSSRV